MKVWKGLIWPFLSKVAKYIWSMVSANAEAMIKAIPQEIVPLIEAKFKEVNALPISGPEKMKIIKEYALTLLKDKIKGIGLTLLETFLQNMCLDLKTRGIIS